MYGMRLVKPAYWKALFLVAPFVAIVAWSLPMFHIAVPMKVLIPSCVVLTLLVAQTIHRRIVNDWRSQWATDAAEGRYKPNDRDKE
jgi:hypothetical protein